MRKGDICCGIVEYVDFPNKGVVRVTVNETEQASQKAEGSARTVDSVTADALEDKVVVKNVIPGQTIRFAVNKKRHGKCEGRLLEVVKRSDCETNPACSHFGVCGGCVFQTMDYESQLKMKEAQVKKLLDEVIAEAYIFEPIIGSPKQTAYRNKMEYSFGDEVKDGPLALGLHKRSSMYDIVTVSDCQLVDADYDRILKCVYEHFLKAQKTSGVTFYHKMSHTGYLRHLLVRKAVKTGDILIDLVTSTQLDYDLQSLAEELQKLTLEGKIVGFLHTFNDSMADAVINERTEIIFGQDYFYEELLGLRFCITPFSFFQTNSLGAEVLYQKAREYIGTTKDKVVFDLYSGTGTIAQLMAPVAKKVIGVEIIAEASEAAAKNAAMNGLNNCEFIAGDVLKVIDDIEDKPELIVLDPPREGIHPKAMTKILDYGVDHIVYISCKASSLAHDLVVMQEAGYRVEKCGCVDMFPMTGNVETVVLLSHKS